MDRHRILVAPGTGRLGRELCRLGRAAGHELTSLSADGKPGSEAPWHAGVEWVEVGADRPALSGARLEAGARLVVLEGWRGLLGAADGEQPAIGELLDRCAAAGLERVVYATEGRRRTDADRAADEREVGRRRAEFAAGSILVQLPEVTAEADVVEADALPEAPTPCPALPVGQAAMALLRAAVEPDLEGPVDCRAATRLGYAAMIQ